MKIGCSSWWINDRRYVNIAISHPCSSHKLHTQSLDRMAERNKGRTVFSPEKCITYCLLYTLVWGSDTELIAYLKNSSDSIFQLWKTHFWRDKIINQHLFHCSERRGFGTYQESLIGIPVPLHRHPFPYVKILWIIWNLFFISVKIQSSRCLNRNSEITMPGTLQNDLSLYKMNARSYQSARVEQHQIILPPALSFSVLQMLKGITVAA